MEQRTNYMRTRQRDEQLEERSAAGTFLSAVDQGAGWTVGAALVVKGSQAVGKAVDKIKSKEKDD
jgi:hypothetical protein